MIASHLGRGGLGGLCRKVWATHPLQVSCVCETHTVVGSGVHHKVKFPHVQYADTKEERFDMRKIRNIGIIAHIDAGKTTTSERVLFLSGATRAMGDVDSGDTVTDYLAQERERGITITSAAITFYWDHHRINLIDTPGHVDFTVEVERCLRVLDGAVTVLDASAGVEAQTLTVWRQATKFRIPSLVFINKMDKPAASYPKCLQSIKDKLGIQPIVIYHPLYAHTEGKREFSGVVNLLTGEANEWPLHKDSDGRSYKKYKISEKNPAFESVMTARDNFLGTLGDLDDDFAEIILSKETNDNLDPITEIIPAIRRVTLNRKAVPVCCGSALKHRAVQPLLEMVCNFLPSPSETQHHFIPHYNQHLCGLAFKLAHHKRLGPLTYLRLYSGDVRPSTHVYNVNQGVTEGISKVYLAHANELQETNCIHAGNIAVVSGFKQCVTGDTLAETEKVAKDAGRAYAQAQSSSPTTHNSEIIAQSETGGEHLLLAGIQPPEPVYFCSVEPPSLRTQLKLDAALTEMSREDPSLRIRYDEESQETIMEAQGELHLEIIKDQLLRDWGLKVFMGPLQINYKEYVEGTAEHTYSIDDTINNNRQRFSVTLSVERKPVQGERSVGEMRKDWIAAVTEGCQSAAKYGPLLGYPVRDISVMLHSMVGTRSTSLPVISACANHCLTEAMTKAGTRLMEPMMGLEVRVENDDGEKQVLQELTKRRAQIRGVETELSEDGATISECIVRAKAPLAELHGFSSAIRQATSGRSHLHMELEGYQVLSPENQEQLVCKMTGMK